MTDTARRDLPDGRWVEYTEEPRAYRLCADDENHGTYRAVTSEGWGSDDWR